MSFLTAALLGLGGYQRGRQANQQYALQQQQQADTHAYEQAQIAAENARNQREQTVQDAAMRAKGLSPTGTPLSIVPPPQIQQIRPNNKGKGGEPTLQELANHEIAYANWLQSQGYGEIAAQHYANATAYQAQQKEAEIISNENARTSAIIQGENQRADLTDSRARALAQQREQFDLYLRSQPTYRDLHPTTGGPAKPEAIAKSTAQFYSDWQKATKAGHLKFPNLPVGPDNPMVGAPAIPPNAQAMAGKMFSRIDSSPDPIATAQTLANGLGSIPTIPATAYPVLKELLYKRAAIAAAKKGTLGPPPGGSDAGNPFPG